MKGLVMHATKVQEKKTHEKLGQATFEQVISENILLLMKNLKYRMKLELNLKIRKIGKQKSMQYLLK